MFGAVGNISETVHCSSIKSGLFTRPLGRYKKKILHSKCLRLIEVCREVNRLLALVIGYAAAVAWVTR